MSNKIETKSISNRQPDAFRQCGQYIEVPVQFLWPTQPLSHYRRSSIRKVQHALAEFGIKFMQEKPVNALLLPYSNSSTIAIDDGHHRSRLAPNFGISVIPCFVASIIDISKYLGLDSKSERQLVENCILGALADNHPLSQRFHVKNIDIPKPISDPRELRTWLYEERATRYFFITHPEDKSEQEQSDAKQGKLISKLISSIQGREKSDDLKHETLRELSFYRDGKSLTRFVAQLETNPLSSRRPFVERFLRH